MQNVTKYYKAGYDAVRKHSSTAYVVMSNRLGPADAKELFPLAKGLIKPVIDIHPYNLFWYVFNNMTVEENIDFIKINRSIQIQNITTTDGPLILIGTYMVYYLFKDVILTNRLSEILIWEKIVTIFR